MIAADIGGLGHLAAALAAVVAGGVNALAGGGSLISFPILTAIGVPPVHANATNTVSLCPGYIGGTFAQRRDLVGLGEMIRVKVILGAIGGLLGSILLIVSSEAVFRMIVPFLILGACALLAFQDRIRQRLARRSNARSPRSHHVMELGGILATSTYGGYFGAGLGIMLVAVLGLFSTLAFIRLNAVKQLLSFVINVCAAAFLAFSGKIEWTLVAVMAPASLVGGHLGSMLATVIKPTLLRPFVIVFGVIVALVYLLR